MNKSYKFRIYPTDEQKHYFALTFGHNRFVYNKLLANSIEQYEKTGKSPSRFDNQKILTHILKKENPWLYDISAASMSSSLKDLEESYRFFTNGGGHPKYKRRDENQSYRLPTPNRFKLNKSNKTIRLEKIPGLVYCQVSQKLVGKPKFITVSRTTTNKYFVSITCEVDEVNQYPKTNKQVGIDLGIKTLATLSDGTSYANPKAFEKLRKKLAVENRKLSRKKKGSNQQKKQRIKVAKVQEKIKNIRNHHQHVITTEIVKNHDIICLETLDVVRMLVAGSKDLSRQLSDASLYEFMRKLEYKAKWHGKTVVKVDQYFTSSKTCFFCKHKKKDLTLSDRKWQCHNCLAFHDRDLNAAKNILQEGSRILQNPTEKKPAMRRSRVRKSCDGLSNIEPKTLEKCKSNLERQYAYIAKGDSLRVEV